MPSTYVGIDIGGSVVSLALRERSGVRLASRRLPENAMGEEGAVAPAVMADLLKEVRREEGIRARDCVLVLQESQELFHHATLPPMTVGELTLNLPYEFRDYITDDPESYAYDYALDSIERDEDGKPTSMAIYAAAAKRDLTDQAAAIFRKAGLRLRVAVPAQMAYMALLHDHILRHPEDASRDVVLANIGYDQTVITLLGGEHFEGSRTVEMGVRDIDQAIADLRGVDLHMAATYRANNFEGVLDQGAVSSVYDQLVFEISKVVNFYNFSNPDKDVQTLYLLGPGVLVDELVGAIGGAFSYPVWLATSLMPEELRANQAAATCALAYAGLLAGEASYGA